MKMLFFLYLFFLGKEGSLSANQISLRQLRRPVNAAYRLKTITRAQLQAPR